MATLRAEDLEQVYRRVAVLRIAELEVDPGVALGIVGPNGSGKSTLLRLLAFVERPARGTIALDGRPVRRAAERRRARRRITLVEQRPYLFPGTVRHNLRYALSLHGVRADAATARILHALERLQLTEIADAPAPELSEGQAQRVALARALALEPDVLLLDEPEAAADPAAARALAETLDEERARGTAVCFASHRLERAYRWSDRLLALARGHVTTVTPENLFRATLAPGARTVRLGPLEVHLVSDRSGPVTVALPPEDLIVSLTPLESSVRNQFAGRITRLTDDGKDRASLVVDVGVELTVRVTHDAVQSLALALGTSVFLSIKAMAVRVY